MDVMNMRWVWSDEVVALIDRRMRAGEISAGELSRRASERFGVNRGSFERQLRAAARSDGVMRVQTADEWLMLVDCHLTDLPCYCAAMRGELPAEQWPIRGRRRQVTPPSWRSRPGLSARPAP
jgi:hypothetical protein